MPLTTTQLQMSDTQFMQRAPRLRQITDQRVDYNCYEGMTVRGNPVKGLSTWHQAGRWQSMAGQQWRRAIHRAGAERAGLVAFGDDLAQFLSCFQS